MRLVVDSNILVAQFLDLTYAIEARDKLREWIWREAELFAPALWHYEASSTIRKYQVHGRIDQAMALTICAQLATLGVSEVVASLDLQKAAIVWAGRLGQHVAYDAAYLALADQLAAPFWTADRRLFNNARALGVDWVFHVVDSRETEPAVQRAETPSEE